MTQDKSADPIYIEARRALLDALIALAPHISAIVVAGAQAIYLHTGDADSAISPYTTDADLAVNPSLLGEAPQLEAAMRAAHFELMQRPEGHEEPGIWVTTATIAGKIERIPVDLIVPTGVAPPGGRRGARLGVHGNRAARRLVGLEAALVDHSPMTITALDPSDTRSITAEVAGPAALLVAKTHKIHDRVEAARLDRIKEKDAADVLRLMQSFPVAEVAPVFSKLLTDPIAGPPTKASLAYMRELFGRRRAKGIEGATEALRFLMDPATIEVIFTTYVARLQTALGDITEI